MTWYLIAAIAIGGLITFGLRALPFAMLKPLRKSKFVRVLGQWMPAGIVLILAIVVLRDELIARGPAWWIVAVATAATVVTHLAFGRRALVSIAVGTTCYVVLVNLF